MIATNTIAIILGLAGLVFMVISFVGIWTFPDFFARLHAQGIGDTLGALLLFLAMMVATGFKLISLKIFLLFFVIMLTNPLGTNLIMMAQIHRENYQDYENVEEDILYQNIEEK